MTDFNERIAALSPAKLAELRERLLKHKAALPTSAMARRPSQGPAPLSFAQERLWFLDQWEPNTATYNIPMALRLAGALNVPVLQKCLSEILHRHEPLRTRFEEVEGQPVQVIQPAAPLGMPLVDLSALPEPEAEARRKSLEEAQRPFDLRRDVMLRATLFRLGERNHILLLNMHHIASDGWSLGLLVGELGTLYGAFIEGKPSPLPELAIQYADFAVWQRQWLQGEVLEEQLGYWKKQLEAAPALLELPADRPRPATQSFHGTLMGRELPNSLAAALGELSRREGATLFMTLLAGFQTLLHRYTSNDEILVGSVIAGRNHTEIEHLIGFFVNTLVFRGDLSGNPSYRTLLGRTRESALGAYAHQDLPFEKLVEEMHVGRNMSHSPLVQVMFVLQNTPQEAAQLAGLEVTPVPLDSVASKFDLTLFVKEREGALQAVIEYNTDLFEAETIRRMLAHYQTLLEGIVSDPDQRVSELPMLNDAERRQVLVDWNRTDVAYPRDRCVHEFFEEQAMRTPDAVAVVFEGRQLTYRELNSCANQLAHFLRRKGVGPDSLVGIGVERSVEMAVGLLGILKAGGAYVPLDPSYPAERLALMLEDTRPVVVLTQGKLRQKLPESVNSLCLDTDWKAISEQDDANPAINVTGDNLAYVMYTSGSTGRPKGIEILHRGIVRLVKGATYIQFSPEEVFLQMAPLAFDASTFEIWGAWLHGARVVIMPPGQSTLREIGQAIRIHKVTTIFITTSLFHTMVEEHMADLKPLRQLLTGGEVMSVAHMQRAFQELKDCRLFNVYGPTESTTFASCYPVGPHTRWDRPIPIGRPIDNTQAFILDANLQPAPIGVPGELYIGGDGLARGYLHRPDLTSEKFIPNPFAADSRSRLYKTGDLARFLPGGDIEFLGRRDYQVKIRGFRIELGEIESVLAALPGVREAVVLAREDTPGDKRLVAYLTVREEDAPKTSGLRGLLKTKMPDYMVPSAFVILDRFPLSPNGKVDRKTLPKPDFEPAAAPSEPPKTPTEIALAGIWSEVLGVKQIGRCDNFFDLGGHSLLAIRIISRIRSVFQIELALPSLFQNPTLKGVAAAVDQQTLDDVQPDELSRMVLEIEGADGEPAV